MPQLHCISGLGADERIFSRLAIPGAELIPLQWIQPQKGEPIGDYAGRMAGQVHTDRPIFLGVSFGGMMALEMAKLYSGAKVIIVSSVKSHKELPGWMKLSGRLGLNKLLPRHPPRLARLEDDFLGTETEEERLLVRAFMKTADPVYLRWAIGQVVNWRNEWRPSFLYHLHGSNDRTFPLKNIHATHIIPGAGHFMIMNRAKEVSGIIGTLIN